jgi:hypothetical protein
MFTDSMYTDGMYKDGMFTNGMAVKTKEWLLSYHVTQH